MKKRLIAAGLWFYTCWYAGSMLAGLLGVSELFGLTVGAALGGLIAADPSGRIWGSRSAGGTTEI